MQRLYILLSVCFLLSSHYSLLGQGCSDSGFCTMGALKPDQPFPKKATIRLKSVELTQHFGLTKYNDHVYSTFVDANINIGSKTNFHVRLPAYTIIEGKMPTTSGWGDLFLNLSRRVIATDQYQIHVSLGAKIYTSQPDKKSSDGLPMPLYLQTTYGSNDLNGGITFLNRQWMFSLGYQRALNQIRNEFTTEQWIGHSLYDVVKVYDQSSGLQRGDDLMFRAERNFRLSRFNFYVGTLNLWRVTQDKTLNENGQLTPVEGSQGLASNLLLGGGYQFNSRSGVRLLTSTRLKERDANPDGLSRDFIAQLSYIVRF
jgi:hypothetical protein